MGICPSRATPRAGQAVSSRAAQYSDKCKGSLRVINNPKISSKTNRGPDPQRDDLPPAMGSRAAEAETPGSVTLTICKDRCAAPSRCFGWVGGVPPTL